MLTLLSIPVILVAFAIGALRALIVFSCDYTFNEESNIQGVARYTGVCIDLEQIGLRNVMCGGDLVQVCNAWAGSNLYIVFFSAIVYAMGCYVLFGVSQLANMYADMLNSHGRLQPGSRRPKSPSQPSACGHGQIEVTNVDVAGFN